MATAARELPGFAWPGGLARVPDDPWTKEPVDVFGTSYDALDAHGWYRNLDPTVAQLVAALGDDDILVDYSGGTGILARRLLRATTARLGVVIVDSSPKFLRVAVDDLADDDRVAFRLLPFVKSESRLRTLDEVLDSELVSRGADALAATNAIHLYTDLQQTLGGWRRSLCPGAKVFISSGNLRNPNARPGEWIIDETVAAINEIVATIVDRESLFEKYRAGMHNERRMAAHAAFREKVFVPVRPLDFYTDTLETSGFEVLSVFDTTIQARVSEWGSLLATYHEGVLGWVGGTEKIDGQRPTPRALQDRLFLIRTALDRLFRYDESFNCCWTYITCRSRGEV
jgi:ubiquinone/menaquinone biosynthesis C-methylase UbiE